MPCLPFRFTFTFKLKNILNKTKKSPTNTNNKDNTIEIYDGPPIEEFKTTSTSPINIEIPDNMTSKEESKKVVENEQIKWEDTLPFTFPITGGQVIKVYDGDTITIASRLPYHSSPLYRLSVRLDGIDTPEIKGKTEDEKEAARNARDAVSNLIMQKYIRLENVKSEKYGRILADVYIGDIHLNQWLIDNRYAVAYDGGTKHTPESWLKYKENSII